MCVSGRAAPKFIELVHSLAWRNWSLLSRLPACRRAVAAHSSQLRWLCAGQSASLRTGEPLALPTMKSDGQLVLASQGASKRLCDQKSPSLLLPSTSLTRLPACCLGCSERESATQQRRKEAAQHSSGGGSHLLHSHLAPQLRSSTTRKWPACELLVAVEMRADDPGQRSIPSLSLFTCPSRNRGGSSASWLRCSLGSPRLLCSSRTVHLY